MTALLTTGLTHVEAEQVATSLVGVAAVRLLPPTTVALLRVPLRVGQPLIDTVEALQRLYGGAVWLLPYGKDDEFVTIQIIENEENDQ